MELYRSFIHTRSLLLNRRSVIIVFILFLGLSRIDAQEISFKDTVAAYNAKWPNINKVGMEVLGAWGISNMTSGGIGYFTAKQDEWRFFHEMNIVCGAVNTGIAAVGLAGIKRELNAKMNFQRSYDRYLSNKRVYLINAGIDLVYIAAGVGLVAYAGNTKTDKEMFLGFGRSATLEGVFLLLFDNVMYAALQKNNSNWFRIMNEIHISGQSVGFVHTFK
jgi:hypothetical protein